MPFLTEVNYYADRIGKTSAAFAALSHCMIDHAHSYQLPTVLLEKATYDFLDFMFGYDVATANDHWLSLLFTDDP
ncbi:MAG: hypothetical protein AAF412_09980 [Pseudomonadota bacterium]